MNELTKTEQATPTDWEVVEEQQAEYIASEKIYIDPRYLFPDMSEEEAMTWNQPNPNPENVWTVTAVIQTIPDYGRSPFYTNIEPWNPAKNPISKSTLR